MTKVKRPAKPSEEKVEARRLSPLRTRLEAYSSVYPLTGVYGSIQEPITVYGGGPISVTLPVQGVTGMVEQASYASHGLWAFRTPAKDLSATVEDLKARLGRATAALQNVALAKADYAITKVKEAALQHGVKILNAFLKMESWSDVTSMIIVSLEDYSSDHIEPVFEAANEAAGELKSADFTWNYYITYDSDNLDMQKIYSDGYIMKHESVS